MEMMYKHRSCKLASHKVCHCELCSSYEVKVTLTAEKWCKNSKEHLENLPFYYRNRNEASLQLVSKRTYTESVSKMLLRPSKTKQNWSEVTLCSVLMQRAVLKKSSGIVSWNVLVNTVLLWLRNMLCSCATPATVLQLLISVWSSRNLKNSASHLRPWNTRTAVCCP